MYIFGFRELTFLIFHLVRIVQNMRTKLFYLVHKDDEKLIESGAISHKPLPSNLELKYCHIIDTFCFGKSKKKHFQTRIVTTLTV